MQIMLMFSLKGLYKGYSINKGEGRWVEANVSMGGCLANRRGSRKLSLRGAKQHLKCRGGREDSSRDSGKRPMGGIEVQIFPYMRGG